ncbi:hypothetical protein EB796_022383 [Bugula neritina]|uniref:Uncharacterized protein n=1 Tax=Bugula neritina TaxID=10212 RepID=A0A7J7J0W8_BUGNE|nr:hypothetical protein EB796_022383 [Bugula neritina]
MFLMGSYVYEVTELWVWGRDETSSFYLNQMQNIKITVTMLESAIDDDDSLCVYRDGSPAAGENRPEVFTCTSSMIGR